MATETNMTKQTDSQSPESREEFISLAEIVSMILRHRLKIAVFVALVTVTSAVFSLLSPRQYKAEGFLQIIPPVAAIDEKVDQASFETIIISHLQTIQSAFMAKEVATVIKTGSVPITPVTLQQQVKIIRPPKSNLIVLTADVSSPEQAVFIVRTWIQKYLASMCKNNVNVALSQVRTMLKKIQANLMETQAKADQLKALAEKTKPLVDLNRGINDNQLWREIADNTATERLKNLSQIHIQGQEQNSDYLTVKAMLYSVDQTLAAAVANRNFLEDVEKYLEYKARQLENNPADQIKFSSNTVHFAETMIKTTDVVEIGEPAIKGSSRGALRKTAIVFFASLLLASFCAYLCEWFRSIKI